MNSLSDEGLEVICRNGSFLTSFGPIHGFLNYICNLFSGLVQYFIHILSHGVLSTEVLMGTLGRFRVRVKRSLVLFQELLFHGDIMVSDAQHGKPVFWLLDFLFSGDLHLSLLRHDFCYELILNQNQSFHGVLKSKLMLSHL